MKHILLATIITISALQYIAAMERQQAQKGINWELLNGSSKIIRDIVSARRDAISAKEKKYRAKCRLWNAVYELNFTEAEKAINDGANPSKNIWQHYVPLLHFLAGHASNSRAIQLCALLLKHGANPNLQDRDGRSALMEISNYNCDEMCALLFAADANLLIRNAYGDTALHISARTFNSNLCFLLIKQQRKVEKRVVTLLACLRHHAHYSGNELYFKFRKDLLKPYLYKYTLRAVIEAKNNMGETAYDEAKIRNTYSPDNSWFAYLSPALLKPVK